VSTGDDVKVDITLTNTTNHEMALFHRNQACDYGVEVLRSHGQPANDTEQKRRLKCGDAVAGKFITVTLKPGESHKDVIFVNKLYDMNRPDTYALQLTREIPRNLGKGQVKSNIIIVTVTQ
jgi:hypothetical protein